MLLWKPNQSNIKKFFNPPIANYIWDFILNTDPSLDYTFIGLKPVQNLFLSVPGLCHTYLIIQHTFPQNMDTI